MKKIFPVLLFCLFFTPLTVCAQSTVQVTQNSDFYTSGQNFWGPGGPSPLILDQNFFSMPLMSAPYSFGGISSLGGSSFGAVFNMSAWAQFGAGLKLRLGGETVEVDYQSDVRLTVPDSLQFNKGQEVTINTQLLPDGVNSEINYDDYNFLFQLWLYYRIGANVNGNVCIFDCYPFTLLNFDLADTLHLFSITDTTLEFFDGLYQPANTLIDQYVQDGEVTIECPPPPMDISAPPLLCAFSLSFSSPSNDSDNDHNNIYGDVLTCTAEPHEYVNLTLSIPAAISDILGLSPDPVSQALSQIFGNLSNSWHWGQFSFEYTVLETGFKLGLYHNKKLQFDPNMRAQMKFPARVDYKVLRPDNGLLFQGTDSIVNYNVGEKVSFRYPCNFDFMDIDSRYSVTGNTFRNHTYDSLSFRFFFEMLSIAGGMPSITVIPGFCFDVWYPCPSWDDPFDWCSYEVCVPPLVFPGIHFDVGPLVDYSYEFTHYVYNWLDNTWTLAGFDTTAVQTFRLKPAKFAVAATSTAIPCFGQTTATATATVTNGTPPYRYEWSNGIVHENSSSTVDVMPNLGPGTQYVIVTDKNNCAVFADVVVSAPAAPLALSSELTPVLCNGNSTGAIELSITGGTPPYSYAWNTGQLSQDLSGLASGLYEVIVTDANNCKSIQQYTIAQPPPLSVSTTNLNADCYGASSGAVSVNASGGVTPYTYLWSNGSTSSEITNVPANIYTVTVTDFNNCQRVLTDTVTQAASPVSLTFNAGDVRCYGGSTGFIHLSPAGGTSPFTVQWFDQNGVSLNQHTSALDSIPVGTFTALITDAQGCILDTSILIQQPPPIVWTDSVVDNLCFGEANGQIILNVSGGSPGYTYQWNNGDSTSSLSGLQAGTFTVIITDQNGCVKTTSAMVSEPATAVAASVSPLHVRCWGETSGRADLTAMGGTAPYSYTWSNGAVTDDLFGLGAGTYTVTVTDNNGCQAFSGITITQPADSLNATITLTNASCNGVSDGGILIQATGGTTPYYLRWDDTDFVFSGASHQLYNLAAGVYQLIITDANDCELAETLTVSAPETVVLEATSTLVRCFGSNDGTINLTASGGTLPYDFVWSNGASVEDPVGLPVGYYTVSVTDDHGCSAALTTEVQGMPQITVEGNVIPISCIDNHDGSIRISAFGGAGDYSFLWSDQQQTPYITGLSEGDYSVSVTDNYGCMRVFNFFVPSSELECISIPNSFTPNDDGVNDTWVVRNIFLYPGNSVKIFNRWGNLLYEASPYSPEWDGTYDGKPLPAETYYYIINLNNGTAPFTGTVTIIR